MLLNRFAYRDTAGFDALAAALESARATGRPARATLRAGEEVTLAACRLCGGPTPEAEKLSVAMKSGTYWAAAIELLVVPNALFFPKPSILLTSDYRYCDELTYGIDGSELFEVAEVADRNFHLGSWWHKAAEGAERLSGVCLLMHPRWHNVYTHWFTEALASICDPAVDLSLIDAIGVPNGPSFQGGSLELMPKGADKFHRLQRNAHRFEFAVFPTHLLARTWVHPAAAQGLAQVAAAMRRRVGENQAASKAAPLYISRQDAPARRMRNEVELVRRLEDLGVRKICASEHSFGEQVRFCADASALVSPHGSGLTNMLYLPDSAPVLEFRPRHSGARGILWDRSYHVLASATGRPYSQVVFENGAGEEEWDIDIDYACETVKSLIA